jgi:hypothetical protein
MNAVAQESLDLEGALAAARQRHQEAEAQCTKARATHEADAEALAGGRKRFIAAEAEVQRLAAEDAEDIAQHARRLEEQTRAGYTGPVPALVLSDSHLGAQITAARTRDAAQEMVDNLEQSEQRSMRELTARSAATAAAARAVKDAEGEIAAAEYEHAETVFLRAGAELWRYHRTGLDTLLNQFTQESPRMQRARERFSAVRNALVSELDVPLNQLRAITGGLRAPAAEPREENAA